jgi:hypothetical protein
MAYLIENERRLPMLIGINRRARLARCYFFIAERLVTHTPLSRGSLDRQ